MVGLGEKTGKWDSVTKDFSRVGMDWLGLVGIEVKV